MKRREGYTHRPVLLEEAVEALAIKPGGIYVDGTFGRGGHSREILARLGAEGYLLVLDRDPEAVAAATALAETDARIDVAHASFGELPRIAGDRGLDGRIEGLLLDLGVSSPQLDDPARGFSFGRDGPLDMRFDILGGSDAGSWLARASLGEIARVLRQYGEEPYAKRIARAICEARETDQINSTRQLADLVSDVVPWQKSGRHPATRVFQAIRMHVNGELEALGNCLNAVPGLLSKRGRLVVISFHSLEDRAVKRFIRGQHDPRLRKLPVTWELEVAPMRMVGKPVYPGAEELARNRRSRSAVMRVAERR